MLLLVVKLVVQLLELDIQINHFRDLVFSIAKRVIKDKLILLAQVHQPQQLLALVSQSLVPRLQVRVTQLKIHWLIHLQQEQVR